MKLTSKYHYGWQVPKKKARRFCWFWKCVTSSVTSLICWNIKLRPIATIALADIGDLLKCNHCLSLLRQSHDNCPYLMNMMASKCQSFWHSIANCSMSFGKANLAALVASIFSKHAQWHQFVPWWSLLDCDVSVVVHNVLKTSKLWLTNWHQFHLIRPEELT